MSTNYNAIAAEQQIAQFKIRKTGSASMYGPDELDHTHLCKYCAGKTPLIFNANPDLTFMGWNRFCGNPASPLYNGVITTEDTCSAFLYGSRFPAEYKDLDPNAPI